jgi:putative spermidine/putrescine transport system substrate-binding protein
MRHLLVAAAASSMLAGLAEARDFTIVSWGGASQDAKRTHFFEPFAKAKGINYLEDVYLGGWAQFKAMKETGNRPWDVVQVESAEVYRGCEEGLFLKIDWDRVGSREDFLEHFVSECGVGVASTSMLVAYNPKLVPVEPSDIADFFDLEKIPGKRGLRSAPKFVLEFALFAEGVHPRDVYKIMNTREGLDRAFAKLDTIKSEIQWWQAGAQPPEWLVSGDIAMTTAYSGRINSANEEGHGLKMIWDKNVIFFDAWVIVAGTEHVDTAYEFLNFFAGDVRAQANYLIEFPNGVPNRKALDLIPASYLPILPVGDNVKDALNTSSRESVEFWLDNQDEITERWTAWKQK